MSYPVGSTSILVVDDDPIAAEMLRHTLCVFGYEVTVASDDTTDTPDAGKYLYALHDMTAEVVRAYGTLTIKEAASATAVP